MDTLQKNSDSQLVKLAKQGNKHAFDILVTRYQHKVISLLSRYVNNNTDAVDLSQEVFLRAYSALANFREDSAFYTWLYRVAINIAKNNFIQNGRRPNAMNIDFEDPMEQTNRNILKEIDSPEGCVLSDETEQRLAGAIEDLPEDLKITFILREIEAFSYEDIANVLDCPLGTVRSRIFRARQLVDKKLHSV